MDAAIEYADTQAISDAANPEASGNDSGSMHMDEEVLADVGIKPLNDAAESNDALSVTQTCIASDHIDCFHMDVGPAVLLHWEEQAALTAGKILVFPFSHGPATDQEQYGRITMVGATGSSEQGYSLRMWFAMEPGGSPLAESCSRLGVADDQFRWNQNKDYPGYCRLPDAAGTVFFHYALCLAEPSDFQCAGDTAEFAPEGYQFHIAGTVLAY